MTQIPQIIGEFIRSELSMAEKEVDLTIDEPLLHGTIDSLGVLRLAAFIEERFRIRVEDEELVPENFQTVRSISEYIERKVKRD